LEDNLEVISIAKQFHKGIKDEDWIPKWGTDQGIFITQDVKIIKTRHQASLLSKYKLGAFFLSVPNNYRYWDKVEVIIKCWPKIVDHIKTNRTPFAFKITPKKIERLSL
jgi:hypothetical protein